MRKRGQLRVAKSPVIDHYSGVRRGRQEEEVAKNIGRAYLVNRLGALGFSRRQSVEIINAILDCMIRALRRGEKVEFPYGWLGRMNSRYSQWWDYIDHSQPFVHWAGLLWQPDSNTDCVGSTTSTTRTAAPRALIEVPVIHSYTVLGAMRRFRPEALAHRSGSSSRAPASPIRFRHPHPAFALPAT